MDSSVEQIRLEPVDEVQVLTVCDNSIDIFLLDQGPAPPSGPILLLTCGNAAARRPADRHALVIGGGQTVGLS